MKRQWISRVMAACAAAGATYMTTHDHRAAIVSGVTFLLYGTVHTVVAPAEPKQ